MRVLSKRKERGMSKFLKVFCCICIVGVLCAPTYGQAVRMYWQEVGGADQANDAGGTVTIYVDTDGVATTVSMNVMLEGIGADFNSAATQAVVDDGDTCTGGGSVDADCTTVLVTTASDNCAGAGTGNSNFFTMNTTATNNCGSLGTGDKMGWLRAYGDPNHYAIVDDGGCYWAEVDFVVSDDCCGEAVITYQGAPDFTTVITDEFQNTQWDAFFSNLVFMSAPMNDDCADAQAVGNETVTVNTTCATVDGTECDGTTADIWYAWTADCKGTMQVTIASGTVGIYAGDTGDCVPSGSVACGPAAGTLEYSVLQGEDYLVQVTGATDSDSITFFCQPDCTFGPAAGDALTVSECGPPDHPGDDVCQLWYCDAVDGCVAVDNVDGTACDDGLWCTIDDACDAGVCVGPNPYDCTDPSGCTADFCIEGAPGHCDNPTYNSYGFTCPGGDVVECDTVTDDYGAVVQATDCVGGVCLCEEYPLLCLTPVQGPAPAKAGFCFEEDKLIIVTVDLITPPPKPICAAQFYLEWDTAMLDFVSIVEAGGVFNTVIFEAIDEVAGTIDYLVGENPGTICTGEMNPATIATLTFLAIGECKTDGVCFRPHNPPTRLGAATGEEVCPKGHVRPDGSCGLLDNPIADPCCTGEFSIDSTAPVVTCPVVDTFGNAECNKVTRNVTWGPITATDNCDGDLPVNCTITHNGGWDVSGLLDGGGDFPPGVTEIDCTTVMDRCDNASDCAFMVVNSGQNGLHVDVELSPTMDPGPLLRGIEFEVSECDAANPETVTGCADVNFGFPKNVPGHGEFQAKLPPGNWMCIEAWDPLHTLKATCTLTCEDMEDKGSVWYASYKGTKDLSDTCHWLVNGNLNGLDLDGHGRIDILDYVTYLAAIANDPIPGANTPCGTVGPHGDINGDGIVNLMDFSFILLNMFNMDKAGCDAVCFPSADIADIAPPRDSISVRELTDMGFGREARAADIDGDGDVTMKDMGLYWNGAQAAPRSVRGSR